MNKIMTWAGLGLAICWMLSPASAETGGDGLMQNVLEGIPYSDAGMGKRKLVDTKHLLIMQAALHPGQTVPTHQANSHVHLLILRGEVDLDLAGPVHRLRQGDLMPVAFGATMTIKNVSDQDASFLIIKTPNPSEMGK